MVCSPSSRPSLTLAFGLSFSDLYQNNGLGIIDKAFQDHLVTSDKVLWGQYERARSLPGELSKVEKSTLLLDLAPHLEDFLGKLFGISSEILKLQIAHHVLAPLYTVRRLFVQREAVKKYPVSQAQTFDGIALKQQMDHFLACSEWGELEFAQAVITWMQDEENFSVELDNAARYAAWCALVAKPKESVLFYVPQKQHPLSLIEVESEAIHEGCKAWKINSNLKRSRDGFQLTDIGIKRKQALAQANYCIWCHHQGKDSCSKGLKVKGEERTFQKNAFGSFLAGCPLEEKISEMNELKSKGYTLGALAVITIDNPMVAATGHRLCNDCMKACIYQKQEPVNIPGVETQILNEVLSLPWGFEIYSLLTRWNPLNFHRPLPKQSSGYKVLVVGLGPAGFTLSHHLLNEGHTVVAIDGLKIEPLPDSLTGLTLTGQRASFNPIFSLAEIEEPLEKRIMAGFGGVAEYGITVRWNKNYLKVIRLLLERRDAFLSFGGIRFGGTLTIDQSFSLGFEHIALCMGAGSPNLIPLKNGLAQGVRQAGDFLMTLQLTGAAKEESLANLQLRLPVVVIGGGLTAIDAATEAMAYYPVQVEKFLKRYQILVKELGEENVRSVWSKVEQEGADEFLKHGLAIQQERLQAQQENRKPEFNKLIHSWGGVTITYRRELVNSPSYTLNHEEVSKALEEGILFAENLLPLQVEVDDNQQAQALIADHHGRTVRLAARSILIAAGTKPNTNLLYDEPGRLTVDGKTFQAVDEEGRPVVPQRVAKPPHAYVLTSLPNPKHDFPGSISFFGDLHPSYSGNVVKAMASAKQGYPVISRILQKQPLTPPKTSVLFDTLNALLRPTVHAVHRLTPTIVEVVVKAPLAARAFRPGQFYRLQNFETLAPLSRGTRLAMEGLALTGASVDHHQGLISTIVLEMGGSSDLCALLREGDPLVLMGPTGTHTHIPSHETVLLAGGGLGNAVLFSIGQELRQKDSRVIYFAGYRKRQDRYKSAEIEAAADKIIWCCEEEPGFVPSRPQDLSYGGSIVHAMLAYHQGYFGPADIPFAAVNRLIVIGSDQMMAAVAKLCEQELRSAFSASFKAFGSINSPMQCMMKEVCAQCLQRQYDPKTGREKIVYSCVNQDQPLKQVDFNVLSTRLRQNSVQEKLTRLWIKGCLKDMPPS